MRNMKVLLKLLGAVSLSTIASSSVIACCTKIPESSFDIAKLLGWSDTDGKSLINQKLNYDNTANKEKYSIIVDDSLIRPTALFKTKLLIQGSVLGKFKAKDGQSAKLLLDLGFKSGNKNKDYSDADVTSITSLSAVIKTNNPGKIKKNGITDFKITGGTCQIEIKNNDTLLKTFSIKTKESNLLVPDAVNKIIQKSSNSWNITFAQTAAYKENQSVITQLPWNTDSDGQKAQKQFNELLKILNLSNYTLLWSLDSDKDQTITTYTNVKTLLTIEFSEIKVWGPNVCGIPSSV